MGIKTKQIDGFDAALAAYILRTAYTAQNMVLVGNNSGNWTAVNVTTNTVLGTNGATNAKALSMTELKYMLNASVAPGSGNIPVGNGSKLDIGWINEATNAAFGTVRFATPAEVNAGTANDRGVTPYGLATAMANILGVADAMVFKGTIGESGATMNKATWEALTDYNKGWTYKFTTAGTYLSSLVAEVGDMVISLADVAGGSQTAANWTMVQGNIDGAVTGPGSAADLELAVFNGVSGKIIKGAGYNVANLPYDKLHTSFTYIGAIPVNTAANIPFNIAKATIAGAGTLSTAIPLKAALNGVIVPARSVDGVNGTTGFVPGPANFVFKFDFAVDTNDLLVVSGATY